MRVMFIPLPAAALIAALTLSVPGHAHDGLPSDFIGSWHNVEGSTQGVTRIDILPSGGNHARVTVYRRCGFEECELGRAGGRIFRNPQARGDHDYAALLVRFDRDGLRGNVLVRFSPRGDLVTHALLDFAGRGGSIYSVERFTRADVPHPHPSRYSRF
jgi:hypothetical protein